MSARRTGAPLLRQPSVLCKYDRSLPIVKVGRNQSSVNLYGKRVLKITNKEIKDPDTAVQLVNQNLNDLSTPKKQGTLDLRNVLNIIPGETCVVNLPNQNIINQTYDIIEANYDFDTTTTLSNQTLSIKVNKKIPDFSDRFKDFEIRLRRLESQDISTSDIITRLEYTTGSLSIRSSGITIYQRTNLGSSFILGKGYHGVTNKTFGGILGSIVASGINFLGDSRNSLSVYWSGAFP